ncbi:MAG TPA: phosphomannomutase/phosphoglucomutase [Syntrophorhabdaceae bacterium]|nr:phosphomannomutase/phosphoglucomutase [Syntrophorhabdaceae bacterium]HQH43499.1 phosphomannomutase/phosphoglucomutase [Syntrophorhabdaceae bacterium]HQK47069.1 phosphomannomutase/phosphoglucomutase [Syntrophorhabdaceae bacterium]HRR71891.1 phosphomannomutase/phosphoglucomutase [Syntrophorhabdaceae bacterium]
MNKEIFREYDIRGTVEKDLTDDVVKNIGRAFASYMHERGKKNASVGRDGRLSSEHLKNLIVEGMVESGISVIDLGQCPTPLFYFSLFNMDVDGGIMVTGSHNPPEFNGFKVAFGKTTLFGEEIQDIRRIIEANSFVKGEGRYSEYKNIVEDYYNFLRKNINIKKSFNIVVDAGNGVAGAVAVPIMKEMGQNVIPLFCDVDGHFPNHFPDPTVEKNVVALRQTVLEKKADVGIGYDGDGDRIGVVDNEGNIIWGDYLMIIFARDIFKERQGAYFVSEVKCSKNLYEDIEKHGGKPVMWKAGHSLIKQKMKELNAVLGGEMSGHMFFADRFFGYDDAIYASLRLIEIMEKEGRPVSEFLKDLPKLYSTPEIRIECPDSIKFQVVKRLTDYYRDRYKIIDIDGVRVLLDDGWGLVRSSNTQPVLVLRFEADTQDALDRIKKMVTDDLKNIMAEF